jgi:hypothetical protein
VHVLDQAHDLLRRLARHPVPAHRVVRRDGRMVFVAPATGGPRTADALSAAVAAAG